MALTIEDLRRDIADGKVSPRTPGATSAFTRVCAAYFDGQHSVMRRFGFIGDERVPAAMLARELQACLDEAGLVAPDDSPAIEQCLSWAKSWHQAHLAFKKAVAASSKARNALHALPLAAEDIEIVARGLSLVPPMAE